MKWYKKIIIKYILNKEIKRLINKIDELRLTEKRNKITILNLEQSLKDCKQNSYIEKEKYLKIINFYEEIA